MTNIVNLRMVKKRKSRKDRELQAEKNRALHSIPKKQRDLQKAQTQQERFRLDAHVLEISKKENE